jgi:hypothetical protein
MTTLLLDLIRQDPILALAIMIIIVLGVYVQIMKLRIMFITRTLDAAFNNIRNEGHDGGDGCLGTLILLIIVVILLAVFFALLANS